MSYENLRNEFSSSLFGHYSPDQVNDILNRLDVIASAYDIKNQTTDIITVGGTPEIVKMFIAAKGVENLAKTTLTCYYGYLSIFFNKVKKPFDKVDANDIRVFLFEYRKENNLLPQSINVIRRTLNSFYTWCEDEEYIQKNPLRKIKNIRYNKNLRRPLEQLELERLRFACKTPRQKAMIDFMYSTGCRVSELCSAKLSDINFETKTVIFRHAKGDKTKVAYLNAECMISLDVYLKTRKDKNDIVFAKERKPHTGLGPHMVRLELHKIAAMAGITSKNVTPHVIRHTTATASLRSGMPVEQVQKLLGHSQISTTMIYAEVDQEDVRRNHERLLT